MMESFFLKKEKRPRNNSIGSRHSIFVCFGSGTIQGNDSVEIVGFATGVPSRHT